MINILPLNPLAEKAAIGTAGVTRWRYRNFEETCINNDGFLFFENDGFAGEPSDLTAEAEAEEALGHIAGSEETPCRK